jgi:hypothetical protein
VRMSTLERRIRLSAVLVAVGVIVLLFSLLWRHPLSFMAFLMVGCPFALGGALLYLLSIATKGNEP